MPQNAQIKKLRGREPKSGAYTRDHKILFDAPEFIELCDAHANHAPHAVEVQHVTADMARSGFAAPLIVRAEHKANLGLRMPDADGFSPRTVAAPAGAEAPKAREKRGKKARTSSSTRAEAGTRVARRS